jgi:hypothetical protein
MLTDSVVRASDGVSDVADEVIAKGPSVAGTLVLGVLVFLAGAFIGFIARLLWPHPR